MNTKSVVLFACVATLGWSAGPTSIEAQQARAPRNLSEYDAQTIRMAETSFNMFERWVDASKLVMMDSEVELISENMQVGGRIDAVVVDTDLAVADWKAGAGLYQDALIQVAAYGELLRENGREPLGGYHLGRFDREGAGFRHFHFPYGSLEEALELFKLYRKAYDLSKVVAKKLK